MRPYVSPSASSSSRLACDSQAMRRRAATAGYDVLVLDRSEDRYAIQGLRAAGARVAYRGADLVVLTR